MQIGKQLLNQCVKPKPVASKTGLDINGGSKMNSVSWFIYAAQVCGSLAELFEVLGWFTLVGIWLAFVAPRVANFINDQKNDDPRAVFPNPKPLRKGWLGFAFTLILLGNLIPGKNTMYAIAVSQVGESIVKSGQTQEMASDATKALQQWIKKQIDPEKTEKK
jgi:hypothetical protein